MVIRLTLEHFLDEFNWMKKNNLQSISNEVSIINYFIIHSHLLTIW